MGSIWPIGYLLLTPGLMHACIQNLYLRFWSGPLWARVMVHWMWTVAPPWDCCVASNSWHWKSFQKKEIFPQKEPVSIPEETGNSSVPKKKRGLRVIQEARLGATLECCWSLTSGSIPYRFLLVHMGQHLFALLWKPETHECMASFLTDLAWICGASQQRQLLAVSLLWLSAETRGLATLLLCCFSCLCVGSCLSLLEEEPWPCPLMWHVALIAQIQLLPQC